MGNRRRTDTCLVGECRAAETHQQGPERTAGDTATGKGAVDDRSQGGRDLTEVAQDDHQASRHIKHRHQRHQFVGHFGDPADAADDHHAYRNRHHHTKHPGAAGEEAGVTTGGIKHGVVGLIDLKEVARTHGSKQGKHGKSDTEKLADRCQPRILLGDTHR